MPTILKSRWTPRVLMFLMLGAVPIQLGAMMEDDHLTQGLFASLSLVGTACYLIVITIQFIIKKGENHAQAEEA
jgi:hypothetical protein